MDFDYRPIWPYAAALLAVMLIYRRLRRSFGPQRLRPVSMRVRMAVLILLACALLPVAARSGGILAAQAAGVAAGAALGAWGARRTKYQSLEGRLHYVPHTYTGIAVSLLLIGRLVYRIAEWRTVYVSGGPAPGAAARHSPAGTAMTPLTVGLLGVVIGYYVCYYGLVLLKCRHITPEDFEAAPASPAGPR